MARNTNLPGPSYGDGVIPRPLAEMHELGRRYADSRSPELLLEICRAFHPYLMKYLVMICAGHVPLYGNKVNKDVEPFLRYFLARGAAFNKSAAFQIARRLHLAFKGMSADEIYDVLMEQLLLAVKKYDPGYAEKVRFTAGKIEEVFGDESFSAARLNEHLEFDCDRYLRLLCRRGFLAPVRGEGKDKRISGWKRTSAWPPPASFFESGAIGFTYYLQTWFRSFEASGRRPSGAARTPVLWRLQWEACPISAADSIFA